MARKRRVVRVLAYRWPAVFQAIISTSLRSVRRSAALQRFKSVTTACGAKRTFGQTQMSAAMSGVPYLERESIGLPPCGVVATNDDDDIAQPTARCVLHRIKALLQDETSMIPHRRLPFLVDPIPWDSRPHSRVRRLKRPLGLAQGRSRLRRRR
jgi:hypothetical protein